MDPASTMFIFRNAFRRLDLPEPVRPMTAIFEFAGALKFRPRMIIGKSVRYRTLKFEIIMSFGESLCCKTMFACASLTRTGWTSANVGIILIYVYGYTFKLSLSVGL